MRDAARGAYHCRPLRFAVGGVLGLAWVAALVVGAAAVVMAMPQ